MERVSDLFIDSQIKAHEAMGIGSNSALAFQELQRWRKAVRDGTVVMRFDGDYVVSVRFARSTDADTLYDLMTK